MEQNKNLNGFNPLDNNSDNLDNSKPNEEVNMSGESQNNQNTDVVKSYDSASDLSKSNTYSQASYGQTANTAQGANSNTHNAYGADDNSSAGSQKSDNLNFGGQSSDTTNANNQNFSGNNTYNSQYGQYNSFTGSAANGQTQNHANSYTPNQNKYVPGGGYGNYYAYQNTAYAAPPKKKEKKYGLGAVIATALACSIIVSGASSAAIIGFYGTSNNTASGGNKTTTINVDETASNLVEAIAAKCIDSVVGIKTTYSLNQFFGSQQASSEGSGVIYSADGYIITNYHVIADTSSSLPSNTTRTIEVYLNNSDEPYTAQVVGYNQSCDLAVLKIEATGLTPIEFADSDDLKVGETAVAIGSPGGIDFMNSVSSGVVSGINRSITIENIGTLTLIQTDAAINPGNSGGALVDSEGKLIGINNVKIADSDYEGMGFAIPSNTVAEVVTNIIENKDSGLPYLGLQIYSNYTHEMLQEMGYPDGVVIAQIVSGGPCDGVGLQEYDIITEFNGNKIESYQDLDKYKNQCKPGDSVELTVYRYTTQSYFNVTITLGQTSNGAVS